MVVRISSTQALGRKEKTDGNTSRGLGGLAVATPVCGGLRRHNAIRAPTCYALVAAEVATASQAITCLTDLSHRTNDRRNYGTH